MEEGAGKPRREEREKTGEDGGEAGGRRRRTARRSHRGDVISGSGARCGTARCDRGRQREKRTFASPTARQQWRDRRRSRDRTRERKREKERQKRYLDGRCRTVALGNTRVSTANRIGTHFDEATKFGRWSAPRDIHLFRGPCFICLYLCDTLYTGPFRPLSVRKNTGFYQLLRRAPITETLSSRLPRSAFSPLVPASLPPPPLVTCARFDVPFIRSRARRRERLENLPRHLVPPPIFVARHGRPCVVLSCVSPLPPIPSFANHTTEKYESPFYAR